VLITSQLYLLVHFDPKEPEDSPFDRGSESERYFHFHSTLQSIMLFLFT